MRGRELLKQSFLPRKILLDHGFFETVDDHLRRHTGDDKSGQTDKRSEQVEFFQYTVDAGGEKHDHKVDENSQKK